MNLFDKIKVLYYKHQLKKIHKRVISTYFPCTKLSDDKEQLVLNAKAWKLASKVERYNQKIKMIVNKNS